MERSGCMCSNYFGTPTVTGIFCFPIKCSNYSPCSFSDVLTLKTMMPTKSFLLSLIQLSCLLSVAFSILPVRKQTPEADDGSLRLLVMGDWGRNGKHMQSEVAHQMGIVGEKLAIDFVISTGDNFYPAGLSGIDDPSFPQSFSQIYTSQSLQKPFFTVLGNRDYRGNTSAQLDPVLNRMDHRWTCMRSYVVKTEVADFFLVDTTPFVDSYFEVTSKRKLDLTGILPRDRYLKTLLQDLNSALRKSTATWKIVVGHHAIRSVAHHGDTKELQLRLLPILEAHGVDLYLNGHDHCLEHISSTDSEIQFFTSGAASKVDQEGILEGADRNGLKFFYGNQGFLSLQLNATIADAAFYDINGDKIYQWAKSKAASSLKEDEQAKLN